MYTAPMTPVEKKIERKYIHDGQTRRRARKAPSEHSESTRSTAKIKKNSPPLQRDIALRLKPPIGKLVAKSPLVAKLEFDPEGY